MVWQLLNRREANNHVDVLIDEIEKGAKDGQVKAAIDKVKGKPNGPLFGEVILGVASILILGIGLGRIIGPCRVIGFVKNVFSSCVSWLT